MSRIPAFVSGLTFRLSPRTPGRKAKRGLWSWKLEWTRYRTSMQIPGKRKNRTEGEWGQKKEKKEFVITAILTGKCRMQETSQNPSRLQNRGERVLCSKHFSFSYCGKIILVILLMLLKCHSSVFKLLHRRSRGVRHRLQACCGCNLPKVTIINVKLL